MHRFAIAVVFASMAVHTASANVVDIFSSDTWSATSTGSNGYDFAGVSASSLSYLNFNLGQIPPGATITGATLTVLDVTMTWNVNSPDGTVYEIGCPVAQAPKPLKFFAYGLCDSQEIDGADFNDDFSFDGFAPPVTDLIGAPLFGPSTSYAIDPSAVPAHGIYPVSILANGAMTFVEYGPGSGITNGTPPLPSFSMNGVADGELEVQFSVDQVSTTPEPSSYGILLTMLLVPLAGVAVKRQRIALRESR